MPLLLVSWTCAALTIFSFGLSQRASAQSPNVTVRVVGSGASIDDAKADAVRQALQYALKQLVVADRVISNDRLLRDRVLSTANGYIETYREKYVKRSDAGYSVEADVTVSASRIENFIGVVAGGGGAISGPLLDDEQQKRLAQARAEEVQRKARGEIFDRLFEEFPYGVLDLKLLKVNLSPTNPNILVLDLQLAYKPTFLRALEGTVKALAEYECKPVPWYHPTDGFRQDFGQVARRLVDQLECLDSKQPGVMYVSVSNPHDTFCLGLPSVIKCFALAKGDYCKSCTFLGKQATIFGRFIDSNGQSALIGKSCLAAPPVYPEQEKPPFLLERLNRFLIAGADTAGRRFRIQVDASAVNLPKAAYFVGLAGLAPQAGFYGSSRERQYRTIGLTSPSDQSKNACDLVEEAVQRHVASGTTAR